MLRGDLATRFGFELQLAYRKRFGLPTKAQTVNCVVSKDALHFVL